MDDLYYDQNTKQWYSKAIAEIQADEDKKILNAIDAAVAISDQDAIEAAFKKLEEKMATTFTTTSNTSWGNGGSIKISGGTAGNIGTATGFSTTTGSQFYIPTNYGSWAYSTYDGYYGSGRYPSAKKPCCEREIQEYKGKK